MIPNEFLQHSRVRTPYGQGLNIQVSGDISFGRYEAKPAKSFAVLIAPVSRNPDSGFRLSRTIQFDDGQPPKRTAVPGVHATMEDAIAEFARWSDMSLALNLPLKDKAGHLEPGAFFYGGRYGDWLRKVTNVTRNGKVSYEDRFGSHSCSRKDFLEWSTTPAKTPTPADVALIDEAQKPKPKPFDPFEGAERRAGALDWDSGRHTPEAELGNGYAWASDQAETEAQLTALYRRDSLPQHLWKPDDHNACAIARSHAEAWVLAELLEGSAGIRTMPSDAYTPTYVDGERRGWVRMTETGFITLHQGSDDDPRDVVVSQFSSHSPYEVMHVAWLRGIREPEGGVGVWDRGPIRDADLMGAALALTEILVQSDRLLRPLDKEDWKAWQHGLPIAAGEPALNWSPLARNNDCPLGRKVVEDSLEVMLLDPEGRDDLREIGVEALMKVLPRFGSSLPDLPFALAALSRDVSAQYTLAAGLLGKDKADEIVNSGFALKP